MPRVTKVPNICTECNIEFRLQADLLKHQTHVHPGHKPHKCNFDNCTYSTARLGHLTVHKKIHFPKTKFACDFPGCESSFAQRINLKEHKRTHFTDTKLACDVDGCPYTTAFQSQLNEHKRTHFTDTKLACDVDNCSYTTAFRRSLAEHKRTHFTDTKFACGFTGCDYTTASSGNLVKHKRKYKHYFVNVRHNCPHCDFVSRDNRGLSLHQMRVHPEPQPVFTNSGELPVRGASPVPVHPFSYNQPPGSPFQERTVKQEIPDPPLLGTLKRKIDNNGPILRNPLNPSESLMASAEGPLDTLRVASWRFFPASEKLKERIRTDIRTWLNDQTNHAARFDKMLRVRRPIDDGPERGDSVFALIDLEFGTVLGPYAGLLHDDTRSNTQSQEVRAAGINNVSKYAFGTLSPDRMVSAYTTGNVLSLINTVALPGHEPIPGKKNNVTAITVGNNITFFLANTFIQAGDELFLDYGAQYEAEINPTRFKEEPLSRSPSPQADLSSRFEEL